MPRCPRKSGNLTVSSGLGGSEIAAMKGVSPFTNNIRLYLNKVGRIVEDLLENWFRLDYGHYLEPLAAEIVKRKLGADIIDETGMFPDFDFMRANLDRLAVMPGGELVIVECKTSNPFAKVTWKNGPPVYYEWQGRHYMAVINAILASLGFYTRINKVIMSASMATPRRAYFCPTKIRKHLHRLYTQSERACKLKHNQCLNHFQYY